MKKIEVTRISGNKIRVRIFLDGDEPLYGKTLEQIKYTNIGINIPNEITYAGFDAQRRFSIGYDCTPFYKNNENANLMFVRKNINKEFYF